MYLDLHIRLLHFNLGGNSYRFTIRNRRGRCILATQRQKNSRAVLIVRQKFDLDQSTD
jgi:hypothetical protein